MADLISSSIVDGGTVEASQITALYDTLTGTTTYDNISIVGTASYSTTASHALNGGGSSINTGSFLITASVSNDTITFTKGNTTTFNVEVDNVTSASYATTASFTTTSQTASVLNPVEIDIAGGTPFNSSLSLLAAGRIHLSGGTGTSTYSPTLNGYQAGTDCFVMVTAISGTAPGENYEAAIQSSGGNGRVVVTDPGGSSSARVSYVVFALV